MSWGGGGGAAAGRGEGRKREREVERESGGGRAKESMKEGWRRRNWQQMAHALNHDVQA